MCVYSCVCVCVCVCVHTRVRVCVRAYSRTVDGADSIWPYGCNFISLYNSRRTHS